jgi:hypothetical protein
MRWLLTAALCASLSFLEAFIPLGELVILLALPTTTSAPCVRRGAVANDKILSPRPCCPLVA